MEQAKLRKYTARVRRKKRMRRVLLAVLLLAALLLLIDRNFRPLVFSLAEARCAAMATRALNGALTEALDGGINYEDLMNVRMDEKGQVALLSANTMRMNLLADRAGDAALRKLEAVSSQKVSVPLGAALGITLLAAAAREYRFQSFRLARCRRILKRSLKPAASIRRGIRCLCSFRQAFASSFRRAQRRRT